MFLLTYLPLHYWDLTTQPKEPDELLKTVNIPKFSEENPDSSTNQGDLLANRHALFMQSTCEKKYFPNFFLWGCRYTLSLEVLQHFFYIKYNQNMLLMYFLND